MSETIDIASSSVTEEPTPRAPQVSPQRRARGGFSWLIALLALIVAGFALWRVHGIEQGRAGAEQSLRNQLEERIDGLVRKSDQRKRDLDTLRSRIADADGINRSVREELLSLGERSRHLEDAVANLAEQRLSGRDALARNEAEFLLQLAQERLALFHDVPAAITAYDLADSALAAVEDPAFVSVRDSLHTERNALEASQPLQTQAGIAALERVRASLATLPTPAAAVAETTMSNATLSRVQQFVARFVHISHGDETSVAGRDIGLTRALAAMDIRDAEAALLARDTDSYRNALARTRARVVASFDVDAAPTKATLAEIDRLAGATLAPAIPELGNALKELRNLRITRALAQPPVAPPEPAAEPATDEATPPDGDDA